MALWMSRRTLRILAIVTVSMVVIVTIQVISWMMIPVNQTKGVYNGFQRGDMLPGKPRLESMSAKQKQVWVELDERRRTVERVCAGRRRRAGVQGVFFNKQHKMAYCFVPKTGCTFWKRVFGFLNNDTNLKTPIHSPFDIPRLHIHLNNHAMGVPWSSASKTVKNYFRFMFSRDPYSRLWSAYLDKFFLPDFWVLFGSKIMKGRNAVPSEAAVSCGNNVSFTEFVDFALKTNEQHWKPVVLSCDPCQFRPHVLGKMDTYTRDALAVLDQAGLGWILEGVDRAQHVRNELTMLVTYNFDVIYSKNPELWKNRCATNDSLGQRLWKTFQYNGYISDSVPYKPPASVNRHSFLKLALDGLTQTEQLNKSDMKEQKERHLYNAFKQLTLKTLDRIVIKYDLDFKMFGYNIRTFTQQCQVWKQLFGEMSSICVQRRHKNGIWSESV